MKFYRARRDAYDYFNKFDVVPYELLTERERNTRARYLKDDVFDVVYVSKFDTWRIFGRRFQQLFDHNGRMHYDRITRERYYTAE